MAALKTSCEFELVTSRFQSSLAQSAFGFAILPVKTPALNRKTKMNNIPIFDGVLFTLKP